MSGGPYGTIFGTFRELSAPLSAPFSSRFCAAGHDTAAIGLGGAGSLVNEWLARLEVGEIVAVDAETLEPSNVPRVVGATRWDAQEFLSTRRSGFTGLGASPGAAQSTRGGARSFRHVPTLQPVTAINIYEM